MQTPQYSEELAIFLYYFPQILGLDMSCDNMSHDNNYRCVCVCNIYIYTYIHTITDVGISQKGSFVFFVHLLSEEFFISV